MKSKGCEQHDMPPGTTESMAVRQPRLSEAGAGKQVKIVGFNGGRGLISRLTSMGILPGEDVEVICNAGGPIIVSVKGSRVSLGRGMARKIIIKN